MKGLIKYSAVATKIRGMRSHLFTTEDYARLAGCGSVKEIAALLKTYPAYASALEELDVENMRREHLERMILRSVFVDFSKIAHFLDRDRRNIMTTLSIQYELRLINNVVREIFNRHREPADLSIYRPMYEGSPNFDFDKVIAARDIDGLIDALYGSPYREPLLKVRSGMDGANLSDYETALYRYYFTVMWEKCSKIKDKSEKEAVLSIYGSEMDFLNIMWIYRAKVYYGMTARDIYGFLIPTRYKLKPSQIRNMVCAEGGEEILKYAAGTHYKKVIDPQDPGSLERAYNNYVKREERRARREHPYSFIVISSYAYDKKSEVDNIVKIIESVRYGYDPKLILEALDIPKAV